jgi:ferredoxin like protein
MTDAALLKVKLGLDVFKPGKEPHICIKPDCGRDVRLKQVIPVCPAGLYSENEKGEVILTVDGCLECGTCRIFCGPDVLEWQYPEGGTGVQYRFG